MSKHSAVLRLGLLVASLVATHAPYARAQNELRLKRAWVKKYADRASITVTMDVRKSHTTPHTISSSGNDGDLHFAGEADGVGLPFVAEVVNARGTAEKPADAAIVAAWKNQTPIEVTGAWRLWFEHPADSQVQGGGSPFSPNTPNPDHSFEIHPVSRVGQIDVGQSFTRIPGYTAYSADTAFPYFDKCRIVVKASHSGISIRSKRVVYNYVTFEIALVEAPREVSDGRFVHATILGKDGDEATPKPRRMVFVRGTAAYDAAKNAVQGDHLTVLGIPRIDLSELLKMISKHGTEQFEAELPYEMIIVGVL
jgi:hypothetical protein